MKWNKNLKNIIGTTLLLTFSYFAGHEIAHIQHSASPSAVLPAGSTGV